MPKENPHKLQFSPQIQQGEIAPAKNPEIGSQGQAPAENPDFDSELPVNYPKSGDKVLDFQTTEMFYRVVYKSEADFSSLLAGVYPYKPPG